MVEAGRRVLLKPPLWFLVYYWLKNKGYTMEVRISSEELLIKTKLLGVYCLFAPRTFGWGIDIGVWQTGDGWKWRLGYIRRS
jgi:hypothetical protein